MIGNRTRRNFKKGLETTYKIGKYGLPVLVRLVLPGGKVVTGVQAAKKLAQYKRAKKMEAGEDIRMDGSKLSDFLKKIGVEQ